MYSFPYDGNRTVHLVDTPGFDDTNRPDAEILQDIALFLSTMYKKKVSLAGIIYLHRITDTRMSGSNHKNLQMLQRLCGPHGCPGVILATSMWGNLQAVEGGGEIGRKREEQLRRPAFWGPMIEKGSYVTRHNGSVESARAIISHLIDRGGNITLAIQTQMADQKMTLDETDAGQYIQQESQELRARLQRELEELEESLNTALAEKNSKSTKLIQQDKEAAAAKAARSEAEHAKLQISLQQLEGQRGSKFREIAAQSDMSSSNALHDNRGVVPVTPQMTVVMEELRKVRAELQVLQQRETSRRHEEQRQRMANEYRAENVFQEEQIAAQRKTLELLQRQAELDRQRADYLRREKKSHHVSNPFSMMMHLFGGGSQDLLSYDDHDDDHYLDYETSKHKRKGHHHSTWRKGKKSSHCY